MKLVFLVAFFTIIVCASEDALPMADFLDAIPGDEEQALVANDEAVDRWEALPLQVSENDLVRDSESVLREDEVGSASLARQEIHEEQHSEEADEMLKDYENLQEDLTSTTNQVVEEDNVAGILEIYNVDDFDEKFDDEKKGEGEEENV
jgi:hypothetical protein